MISFGGGCGYFAWADDCTNAAVQNFKQKETDEEFDAQWVDHLIGTWQKMTTDELKSLLRKRDCSTKGKKAELIERLEDCAKEQLSVVKSFKANFKANSKTAEEGSDILEVAYDALQQVFGHDEFRFQQEWAVERILKGESTLLIQSTGSGKSLCYQLPAVLQAGLTIVISPLVSLMEDQLKSLPFGLPGAMLSGKQSAVETAKTLKRLKNGNIRVLFVSPERLFSSSFQRLLRTESKLFCVLKVK